MSQDQRVLVAFRSPPRLSAYAMQDGAPLGTIEICGDADDVFVDAKRGRVYVSCGEGMLDILETRDRRDLRDLHVSRPNLARERRCSVRSVIDCLLPCEPVLWNLQGYGFSVRIPKRFLQFWG